MSDMQTILVVDDTPDNIDVLSALLRDEFRVKAALSGERALRRLNSDTKPDMILLDVMMPGMDGYEVCRRLKADPATADIPVIFVTAEMSQEGEKRGLELGAVDYITKPISPAITLARVKAHLSLHNQKSALQQMVDERTKELHDTRMAIIQRLGRAAEFKDNETGLHVSRMSHYTRLIAEAYVGGSNAWTETLFHAAPMHDIGKIGIPDKVLLKPGKLDADEWEQMKRHTLIGAEILGDHDSKLMKMAKQIALMHHEKWDGSGYPYGLQETEISLEARIVAVADVFDALTSDRPYKKAWSVDDTVNLIGENSGSHFDPKLVPLMHEVLPDMLEIKNELAEQPLSDDYDSVNNECRQNLQ